MPPAHSFTTRPVPDQFQVEIGRLEGTVRDSFDDGRRLFARAVLKECRPVKLNDTVQSGVAIRADAQQVCVHPYVCRLICKNGAIWAQALESVRIEEPIRMDEPELAARVREVIRECASPVAFETAVGEMRSSVDTATSRALTLSAMYSEIGARHSPQVLNLILENYAVASDFSLYGLMNAVTAMARDTDDPETRWGLEVLGAGIPTGHMPPVFERGGALSLREAYLREMGATPTNLVSVMEDRGLVCAGV